MDAAALSPAVYRAILDDLAQVNTLTLSRRPTLNFLDRVLGGRRALSLLDVGFGQGDMLRRIARWADRRGIAARLTGIDLNPKSEAVARAATPPDMAIEWRTGDAAELAGQGYDVVVSSLVTHHMSDAQLIAFLRFMEGEARLGWLVNDLHRHRFAHLAFPVLATVMRWHPIVRADGRLSIARAFRRGDWQALLDAAGIAEARIVRRFPFRLCVERIR